MDRGMDARLRFKAQFPLRGEGFRVSPDTPSGLTLTDIVFSAKVESGTTGC